MPSSFLSPLRYTIFFSYFLSAAFFLREFDALIQPPLYKIAAITPPPCCCAAIILRCRVSPMMPLLTREL